MERRSFLAQNLAHRQARAFEQLRQKQPRRRAFEIFDDMRLDAGVADHRQRVARGFASGVVVNDDIHQATSGRGFDAPGILPFSRTCAAIDSLSRLSSGRFVKTEIRFLR